MTKSQRMNPLLKLAERNEQQAARALGVSQQAVQTHEQQLVLLLNYRQEYAERMQSHGSRGMSVTQMQGYQSFLARLDEGIREQRHVLLRAQEEFEHQRRLWQQSHIRTQSLDKVKLRYLAEEVRVQERKDQKDTDERAQRVFVQFKD